MTPSAKDIDLMTNIMNAMNGNGPSLRETTSVNPTAATVVAAGGHVDPISDMKKLIMAMNGEAPLTEIKAPDSASIAETSIAENASPSDFNKVLEAFSNTDVIAAGSSSTNKEIREAMVTSKTDNGVRVGSWEITIQENNGLKSYTVLNIHTGEPIASDLTLYDAAKGIASSLNEGMTINTPHIRRILNAEGAYSRARQSAANYRQTMIVSESRGNIKKKAIAEDRYNEALRKAKEARLILSDLV